MKLIVSLSPSTGGAEKYLQNIEKYYCGDVDCKVAFITNVGIETTKFKKNNIALKGNKWIILGFINFFFFWLKNIKNFNRVYSSHISVNAFIGLLKFFFNSGIIIIARESTSVFLRYSGLRLIFYKILYKYFYKSIDVIVCQTELMKHQITQKVSLNDKIIVLSNPFNYDNNLNEIINLNEGINIVSAGRLIKEKGFDILIKSFERLRKENKNVNLHILGEGSERKNLEKLINKLKIENNVHLCGFKTNPLSYFAAADICVISSRKEGFPNVMLEMLSVNNNVLITPCCGNLDKIPMLSITKEISEISLYNSILIKLKNIDKTQQTQNIIRNYLLTLNTNNYINQINNFLKNESK